MTERISASKRLEEKVDILLVEIYSLKGDVGAIQKQMEMQPKIDQQSFDSLKQANTNCQASNNHRFGNMESRVDKVEQNQTWISRTIIGTIIAMILQAVYTATKGL